MAILPSCYGIIRPKAVSNDLDDVLAIVEKPTPEKAPSRIGVVGRYILSGRIFHHLEKQAPGSGGEIQLTDAIEALLQEERVVAYRFKGTRYDCGSKLGYLAATVAFGRKHPEVGAEFAEMLSAMVR
jgi:UTP--glucose-1-phosphate uridylyltransferase